MMAFDFSYSSQIASHRNLAGVAPYLASHLHIFAGA